MESVAMILKRREHGDQPETNDEADDRRKNWYIDKSINIPTLISIITALGAITMMYGSYTRDRQQTQDSITELRATDVRTMEAFKELKVEAKDTSVKVDMIYGNQREQMATLARIERKR